MRLSNNFLWFVFLLGWIVSLVLMLSITFYFLPRAEQAYERGKIDGEVHVCKPWNEQLGKLVDRFEAMGLLPPDSTDTMPAVEETTYVDTFYKQGGVWRPHSIDTTSQPDE